MTLKDNGVYVNLQVRDMGTFAQLNQLYVKSFALSPPVRVCVQNVTADQGEVCMGAYCATKTQLAGRQNLHV